MILYGFIIYRFGIARVEIGVTRVGPVRVRIRPDRQVSVNGSRSRFRGYRANS